MSDPNSRRNLKRAAVEVYESSARPAIQPIMSTQAARGAGRQKFCRRIPAVKGMMRRKKGASFQSIIPGKRILKPLILCYEKGPVVRIVLISGRKKRSTTSTDPVEIKDKVIMVMEKKVVAVL